MQMQHAFVPNELATRDIPTPQSKSGRANGSRGYFYAELKLIQSTLQIIILCC